MSAEIQKTIEELGRSWEQFKAANDQQITERAKGYCDPLIEEKTAKLNDRISDLTAKLDLQQKAMEEAVSRMARPGGGERHGEQSEHAKAFLAWARKGEGKLSPDQFKAMSVGSDPDGGYTVPTDMTGRIVAKVYETSNIRAISNVDTTSSDSVEGMSDSDEVTTGWVAEQGTRSETDTPELGKWRIEIHEQYAEPKVTQKLLDDSAMDIGAWLERKVAQKFGRTENTAFITGNGVNKPRGFASYSTVATPDSSRAWGVMEHVLSGAAGDFAASNPSDKLLDLAYALKQDYRTGARWVTSRAVMLKVRKFKEATTNAYIWQPGLQAGQPALIIGYPVTEAEDMPALAADSLSMAFGNFKEGFQIYDRMGIRVLRDNLTAKGYVKFYTTKRVGSGVVNFEAIKFMKFNA